MAYWKTVVKKSRRLGEEFFEAIVSGKIKQMVKPL